MSRSCDLSCQSKRVCLVIRKNIVLPIEKIKDYCELYCEKYAFIEHKQDIDSLSGEVIPPHYHLVMIYSASKVAFSTRLNDLCKYFGFENPFGIQIEKMISLESSIQYLLHKNDKMKTPHKKDEIISNYVDSELELLLESTSGNVITFDTLFKAVMSARRKSDIIKEIGLGYFSHNWRAIEWLWEDYRNNRNPYKQDSEIEINN